MPPASLCFKGDELVDGRARNRCESDSLFDVERFPVNRTQERRAHWAGALALRSEHVVVGDQGLVAEKQIFEAHRTGFALKSIVLSYFAAQWQGTAHFGDALEVPSQFNFFCE